MVVAMLVGMGVLFPLWALATTGLGGSHVLRGTVADTLAMASTMAVGMTAWMRLRGHGWAPVLEMSAAMYAGFAVLYPAYWLGGLDEMDVMMTGHFLMFGFMLLAMLWRRDEYSLHRRRGGGHG